MLIEVFRRDLSVKYWAGGTRVISKCVAIHSRGVYSGRSVSRLEWQQTSGGIARTASIGVRNRLCLYTRALNVYGTKLSIHKREDRVYWPSSFRS